MGNTIWAKRQKLQYTLLFAMIIALLLGYPTYVIVNSTFYKPPTCTDGKQNQDERGVDCGGVCDRPCVGETQNLEVLWVRTLSIGGGYYDFAAKINNPNSRARLDEFTYTIHIYDTNGKEIYNKEKTSYADAGERFLVFEANVYLGNLVPAKTEIKLQEPLDWLQSEVETVTVKTGKRELVHTDSTSRLNVALENTGFVGQYDDIEIFAVVSDITGTPIGVSQTYVDSLPANTDKNIFFTWPISLQQVTKGLCDSRATLPKELLVPTDVVLVFDRSGSMNNDQPDPPQPLTDAKNAAKVYADQMLSVDKTSLVSFAAEASDPIDQSLTDNVSELKDSIDSITIGTPDNEQHTNLGDGIKKALTELARNGRDKAKKAIIVLTDGVATRPLDPFDRSNEAYAEEYAAIQAAEAQKEDIFLYVIGLGSDINEQFLAYQIASAPDRFYKAKTSDELSKIYADIAQAVCEEDVFLYELFIRIPNDS